MSQQFKRFAIINYLIMGPILTLILGEYRFHKT
nr:MAG TPA: hypothetical protein [Caudoviricetes sp.]